MFNRDTNKLSSENKKKIQRAIVLTGVVSLFTLMYPQTSSASSTLDAVVKKFDQYDSKYVNKALKNYFDTYPSKAYRCNEDPDLEAQQCALMNYKLSEYARTEKEAESIKLHYKLIERSPLVFDFTRNTEYTCDNHYDYVLVDNGTDVSYFFEHQFDKVNEKYKKGTITPEEEVWFQEKLVDCRKTMEEMTRVLFTLMTDPNFKTIYEDVKANSESDAKSEKTKQAMPATLDLEEIDFSKNEKEKSPEYLNLYCSKQNSYSYVIRNGESATIIRYSNRHGTENGGVVLKNQNYKVTEDRFVYDTNDYKKFISGSLVKYLVPRFSVNRMSGNLMITTKNRNVSYKPGSGGLEYFTYNDVYPCKEIDDAKFEQIEREVSTAINRIAAEEAAEEQAKSERIKKERKF